MARRTKHEGVIYQRSGTKIWWMRYRDSSGTRRLESTNTEDWDEAQRRLRERLHSRDNRTLEVVRKGEQLLFRDWVAAFMENYSTPPIRAPKTHEANERAMKHLQAVSGTWRLIDVIADHIEDYLRARLKKRARVKNSEGYRELELLKATTVHQEFRVLRRALNVAVRKKLLPANPCSRVEFPVSVRGLFRPHYVTWSEQQMIEFHAPDYLRNVIRINTETGLRVYKGLAAMKKDQVDLENATVWIPDSKTANGVAEVPLTQMAIEAFRDQLRVAGDGSWLFPSDKNESGHQTTFKTAWHKTLKRAKVPPFRIYDLRSTHATRPSAGGVADEWVYPDASPRRREGLQKVLPDETSDEA
ncbi:MAG: tyrosine-type recombinase/integrase [Bryobacteraceae bacterium]